MAQDRMLREGIRQSEKVNGWPIPLRYFWSLLWGYCDDWGRGRYDPRLIVADAFPIDEEVNSTTVGRWMEALVQAGVIVTYEVAGKKYFACVNWDEHQEISYRKKTTVPDQWGEIPSSGQHSKKFQNISEKSEASKGKGREVEGEIEGEGETPPPVDNSPFCKKHPTGTTEKCRACGDARRRFEAAAESARSSPTPAPRKGNPDAATCKHKWTDNYCATCLTRRDDIEGAA